MLQLKKIYKRITQYFLWYFLFVSCTSNTILEEPEDLIAKDKMVDLLTDMFIVSGGRPIKNNLQEKNADCYTIIFEKYGVDTAQFARTNYYYTSKVYAYDEMLKEVEKRLKFKKDSIEKILKEKGDIRHLLNAKRSAVETRVRKIARYEFILKQIDTIKIHLKKKRDSLASLQTPLLIRDVKKTEPQRYYVKDYKAIDTVFLENKLHTKQREVEVFEMIKKDLFGRIAKELGEKIKIRKDSISYLNRVLRKDTIMAFPLPVEKEVSTKENYLKVNHQYNILEEINQYFSKGKIRLEKERKEKDSIYQRYKKEIDSLSINAINLRKPVELEISD